MNAKIMVKPHAEVIKGHIYIVTFLVKYSLFLKFIYSKLNLIKTIYEC